jgi:hypothetical protein
MHTITFAQGDQTQDFKISRRYDASLTEIAQKLGIEMPSESSVEKQDVKVEFA